MPEASFQHLRLRGRRGDIEHPLATVSASVIDAPSPVEPAPTNQAPPRLNPGSGGGSNLASEGLGFGPEGGVESLLRHQLPGLAPSTRTALDELIAEESRRHRSSPDDLVTEFLRNQSQYGGTLEAAEVLHQRCQQGSLGEFCDLLAQAIAQCKENCTLLPGPLSPVLLA